MATTAPYGSWASPISASMLAEGGVRLGDLTCDGGTVSWVESRPREAGRSVVVRRAPGGEIVDVTPPHLNSRTRVHEYGGAAYGAHGRVILTVDFADQRVYRLDGGDATPITPEPSIPAGDRYADFAFHDGRVICVQEHHRTGKEAKNTLVTFAVDGSEEPRRIAKGHDFFSSPRVSPDGEWLAWLAWDHPRMPWDGTELWVAALDGDGGISEPERVAGGAQESIFQPEWSPAGVLHYASDRTGWWNLYRVRGGVAEAIHPMDAEFGFPQWEFGMRRYGFLGDGRLVCSYTEEGLDRLAVLEDGTLRTLHLDCDHIDPSVAVGDDRVWLIAGNATMPEAVVEVDVDAGDVTVLRSSLDLAVPPAFLSRPEPLTYPTRDGDEAHAFVYPPHNPDYAGPDDELPPLVVLSHGGPTGSASSQLQLHVQFWTTRGFGAVDVNYRGSAGFGRAYRDALKGRWGLRDTTDCIDAALHLADEGKADPERMAIRGGSAGGFTTLCALTFHDVFAAGASYFGVGDCAALATDTHKFESRYLDSLIGPYPEAAEVYWERSPVHFADEITCPVILLQGLDDEVVPPEQAEDMVAALVANQIPHAYLPFPGEGHGFRMAEHIRRAQEAELSFYAQVFGFEPADDMEPVEIAFADRLGSG